MITLLSVAVMAFGIYGMYEMDDSSHKLYDLHTKSVETLGDIRMTMQSQRLYMRNLVLYHSTTEAYRVAESAMDALDPQMDALIETYKQLHDGQVSDEFLTFESLYLGEFRTFKSLIRARGRMNETTLAIDDLAKSSVSASNMSDALQICYITESQLAAQAAANNTATYERYSGILIALALLVLLTAILVSYTVIRSITKPLKRLIAAANTVAGGDMEVDIPEPNGSEIGELSGAFRLLTTRVASQTEALSLLGDGDLSIVPSISSDRDMIGQAIAKVSDNLNRIVSDVRISSSEVAHGAQNVSDGSQELAQGAAEQASAIEQLSSSILEISLNTKENAKMAAKAANLYDDMRRHAQEGTALMQDMMKAVTDINAASENISRIIKLINDIAFQTNILSLNASVEAANAGQHGKGFAVVAEAVRDLATKSSEAAKDTDALIETSLETTQLGVLIASKTSKALKQIVDSVMESAQLIDEIAKSSSEQSVGIEQVNLGIEQVAQVVNMNSATAERSATAAEQMASRASSMERRVSVFKLKQVAAGQEDVAQPDAPTIAPPIERPAVERPVINLDDDFGKY